MGSTEDFINETTNGSLVADPTLIFGPQRDPLYIVLPITIIYSLIFVTGLIGNIFTCLVIVRNKSMHTATNYYLFSLAISDLLLLVSGIPQEMYSIWSKWPYVFGHSFCLLRGLASETSTNASVLTITLFTIERYLAICHPFVSHKMSKLSRATRHVMMLWVAAFAFALPQALQFGIKDHQGITMCLQTRVIIEHSFELSTFFFFFAPMVLITVLYSLIGLRLRKTSISKDNNDQRLFERSRHLTHEVRRKSSQSTKRVVKMLVAVVVAFFICWAPFHAQRLVAIYGTTENHQAKSPILLMVYSFLTYISGVFYYVSTCINPIFYHIMSNKFREAFKNTVIQWCCHKTERANGKRCSYTAMAFLRNQTSSGTMNSGNSPKIELSNGHKKKHDSKDNARTYEHDMKNNSCNECKRIASLNREYHLHSCFEQKLLKLQPPKEGKRYNSQTTQSDRTVFVNEQRQTRKLCCSHQTLPTEETTPVDTTR
ncbi:pyrokinin-1 receptor-like [Galleria mellonella]|uniref:Pyrokinin-1 receptor-like n=1 Tax=Galleria mellonella TaxID=7137 RepID=A0A6J1WLL3_GALME|nr:pyrokinin-1 receptor-like [Galleria mellonella]